jgi:putative addiction module killer protein
MHPTHEIEIEIYTTETGELPFTEWLESLKDKTARYRIKVRLDRVSLGNLGDYKPVERGVSELRLKFGPGYRIYFGYADKTVVLLLCGGDKSSQEKDIKRAIYYWEDYLARLEYEK